MTVQAEFFESPEEGQIRAAAAKALLSNAVRWRVDTTNHKVETDIVIPNSMGKQRELTTKLSLALDAAVLINPDQISPEELVLTRRLAERQDAKLLMAEGKRAGDKLTFVGEETLAYLANVARLNFPGADHYHERGKPK